MDSFESSEQTGPANSDDMIRELASGCLDLLADMAARRLTFLPEDNRESRYVAFHVQIFAQSSLWRCVDLAESSLLLLKENKFIAAIIAARGLIESVASFHYFEKELFKRASDVSAAGVEELKKFIVNSSFSGRLKEIIENDPEAQAVQILKQIDSLSKAAKDQNVRETYDHLCEYTHPNSYGCVMSYSEMDPSGGVRFGSGSRNAFANFNVLKSIFLLNHFRDALDRVDEFCRFEG